MKDDDQVMLRLAEAVADGTSVDWERETTTNHVLNRRLSNLQKIESVAAAHRDTGVQATPASDETVKVPVVRPERWGSLEIGESIGRGAYGEVYRARDPALGIDVALKLLNEQAVQHSEDERDGFLHEARKLASVRHPNVLVVHGVDRHEGRVGLWTELLQGKNLEQQLDEQGPLGPEEATLIGIELCRALAAVHGAGLIHSDVKTSNVMREQGGRIVLMDFSSVVERPRLDAPQARIAPLSGTPAFMAPELFDGAEANATSDVYSLGVVLYRLVSRRFPVEASTLTELCEKHRAGASVPLRDARPDLPPAFVQVVERALDAAPARRFPTVGKMELALAAALGLQPEPAPAGPESSPRRNALLFVAAAMLVIVAVVWLSIVMLAPGALDVEASLYRMRGDVEERFVAGGRVVPGDSLFLELRGSRPMHVYVFNEDERGSAYLLFPLPDLDLQNPLPADTAHRLPGASEGVVLDWDVTSAGGRETILVIASRTRLEELEREIERLPRAEAGRPIAVATGPMVGAFRGIGGLSPSQRPSTEGYDVSLSAIAEELSREATASNEIWVRNFRLDGAE